MAVRSCWILAGTGTRCRIRRSRASKHAQWVTCPVSMLDMQELVPDTIECEHLPTQVGYDDELQSGRDPDEDDKHADELT